MKINECGLWGYLCHVQTLNDLLYFIWPHSILPSFMCSFQMLVLLTEMADNEKELISIRTITCEKSILLALGQLKEFVMATWPLQKDFYIQTKPWLLIIPPPSVRLSATFNSNTCWKRWHAFRVGWYFCSSFRQGNDQFHTYVWKRGSFICRLW